MGLGLVLVLATAALTAPPLPDAAAINAEIARVGDGAVTSVVLDVNSRGKVDRCTVTGSSGSEMLDVRACEIFMQQATFTPKRSESGKAVSAPGRKSRIVWRVEG